MSRKICIYITAGFPTLQSTTELIRALDQENVDYIEVGMPYSDPLADGQTIQQTSQVAIENGMNLTQLFTQLKEVKDHIRTPLIYMGYFNPVLQFGIEKFLSEARESGVSGLILPDLPMELYARKYQSLFKEYNIGMNFLVSPSTSDERIKRADELSDQYLYVIAQNTITGTPKETGHSENRFFDHLNKLNLKSERLIGFGISNKTDVDRVCQFADGAIIGSAFLKKIGASSNPIESAREFVRSLYDTD